MTTLLWLLLYAALICVPVGIASAMLDKRGDDR